MDLRIQERPIERRAGPSRPSPSPPAGSTRPPSATTSADIRPGPVRRREVPDPGARSLSRRCGEAAGRGPPARSRLQYDIAA